MLVRITKKQATRLLREKHGDRARESLTMLQDTVVHLQTGVYLTHLRADQSPDKRAGYHIGIE